MAQLGTVHLQYFHLESQAVRNCVGKNVHLNPCVTHTPGLLLEMNGIKGAMEEDLGLQKTWKHKRMFIVEKKFAEKLFQHANVLDLAWGRSLVVSMLGS